MRHLVARRRKQLYDVMASGPLHSGMMDFVAAYAVDKAPSKLAFSIRNARKDIGYYSQMADSVGAPSIMSSATKQAFGIADANGYGERMVSEMVSFYQHLFKPEQG